jgi:hypothetical protein
MNKIIKNINWVLIIIYGFIKPIKAMMNDDEDNNQSKWKKKW